MTAIRPKPGFNWMMVAWGGPDEPRTASCSYCGDPFPTEELDPEFVPLILWNAEVPGAGTLIQRLEIRWSSCFCRVH
jgi:hypothetical protein